MTYLLASLKRMDTTYTSEIPNLLRMALTSIFANKVLDLILFYIIVLCTDSPEEANVT